MFKRRVDLNMGNIHVQERKVWLEHGKCTCSRDVCGRRTFVQFQPRKDSSRVHRRKWKRSWVLPELSRCNAYAMRSKSFVSPCDGQGLRSMRHGFYWGSGRNVLLANVWLFEVFQGERSRPLWLPDSNWCRATVNTLGACARHYSLGRSGVVIMNVVHDIGTLILPEGSSFWMDLVILVGKATECLVSFRYWSRFPFRGFQLASLFDGMCWTRSSNDFQMPLSESTDHNCRYCVEWYRLYCQLQLYRWTLFGHGRWLINTGSDLKSEEFLNLAGDLRRDCIFC